MSYMPKFDLDYYQRREQQEIMLAQAATNPTVAFIHLDLAKRYALLIQQDAGVKPLRGWAKKDEAQISPQLVLDKSQSAA